MAPWAGNHTHFLRGFSVLLGENNSYLTSTNNLMIHSLFCFSCIFTISKLHKTKSPWLPVNLNHNKTELRSWTYLLKHNEKTISVRNINNQTAKHQRMTQTQIQNTKPINNIPSVIIFREINVLHRTIPLERNPEIFWPAENNEIKLFPF